MSAPAMKVVPAPISTTARAEGSAAARVTAASMPSGTPGLRAFTGGLSTVITATSFWISYRTRSGMGAIMTPPRMALAGGNSGRRKEAPAPPRREIGAITADPCGMNVSARLTLEAQEMLQRFLDQSDFEHSGGIITDLDGTALH